MEIIFVKFNLLSCWTTEKSTEGSTSRVKYQACYEENPKILECKDYIYIYRGRWDVGVGNDDL